MMLPSRNQGTFRFWLVIRTVLLLISTTNGGDAIATSSKEDDDYDECPLWMALSYTSTDKKPIYGLFAGRRYQENETLPNSELAIPMIDFVEDYNRDTPLHDAIIEFFENHLWTGEYAGSQWEGNHSSPVVIPGIGVLANYHTGGSNVDFAQASVLLRDRESFTNPGKAHPSRGAITPYYDVTLHATSDIPAGMELLADFGGVWDGNYTDDVYQDTIHRYDYEQADKIIDALVEFYQDIDTDNFELQQDILDFMLHNVLGTVAGKHAKTIRSLIPDNPKKLKVVQAAGGSFLYRYADMIRTPQWLRKNGICLNALKAGVSTIPNAGRGAFSAREIRRRETIAITPMLHIADKDLLTMYPIISSGPDGKRDYDRQAKPIGKQLLMNYCFGHPESSMLLFPLGSMITLINHNHKEPNAYITWSKRNDNNLPNQHEHHDMTVAEMAGVDKVVLVMKVVALKEIGPDEEIFLDYGTEWEKAWQDYHIKWEMGKEPMPHPLKAEDIRAFYAKRPLETRDVTLPHNPYPPNLATACFLRTRERPDGFPMINPQSGWDITEWYEPADNSSFEDYKGSRLKVVDVLDRKEAPGFFYNYTVVARISANLVQEVVDVPHAACTFVDAAYQSDIHMRGAFRHPIGILDNHWPQAWRDLR
jgi:hypothetical protein